MSSAQANPSISIIADIDYWLLKPKVRDIQWSNKENAHLAHLYDEQTGLKGSMKVCIDCITVHVYVGCDGKPMDRGFTNCNMKRPFLLPSHIEVHYDLEPNNKYVQHAILRTHRRKLVPNGRHGILEFRGYDPPENCHGRHVPKCVRGSSPEYIIQGNEGLGTSIYYRRCDGRFRNLAHQVLNMVVEPVTANQSPQADDDQDKNEGASSSLVLMAPCLRDLSTESAPSSATSRSLKANLPAKRKRED